MKFELKLNNRNASDKQLLDDLKNVAIKLETDKITQNEYKENGRFDVKTIANRFGSWNQALEKADLKISVKHNLSEKELFENIEEVWIKLGRQPYYREMKQPISKYTPTPYEKRFGTFIKALEAFIEYVNSNDNKNEEPIIEEKIQEKEKEFKHKTKRNPSDRLKVQVLMRDGNKCRLCGIIVEGDNIHFDHIKPWSKGGETVLENLQVLCAEHNLAKGNLECDEK